MATDFNNTILASNGFKPTTLDTPLDVRTRIQHLGEVPDIPNPYRGMIFFVTEEDTYYRVKTLKSKVISGIVIENAVIESYELFSSGNAGGEWSRNFQDVFTEGSVLPVDYSRTPFAKIELGGKEVSYELRLSNMHDGNWGQLLVFQQGGKYITFSSPISGSVELPMNKGTVALLTYDKVGDVIYIRTDEIVGDLQYPNPSQIEDFLSLYYDNTTCIVQWTSPYGNDKGDIVSEYDLRYSNVPIDPDDPAVWSGLKRLSNLPVPERYGTLQKYSITGLAESSEYYCYIKAIKINNGVRYVSVASDGVYFKTKGYPDEEGYYKLILNENMLSPRLDGVISQNGEVRAIGKILDEEEKDLFMPDGYPDTENKSYTTFWRLSFNNLFNPWEYVYDLHRACVLDKMFFYAIGLTTGAFRVFTAREIGAEPEYVTTVEATFNRCAVAELGGKTARLIILKYDMEYFGSSQDDIAEGEEFIPTVSLGNNIGYLHRVMLYGRMTQDVPLAIVPPVRNKRMPDTVDEFFNVVGWFYQQGKLMSLVGGSNPRLFGSSGHFMPDRVEFLPTKLTDVVTRANDIKWVRDNNGTGDNFREHLEKTYKKYGLKPFTASSSWPNITMMHRNGTRINSKPLDNHWLPGAWVPLPFKGMFGTEKYMKETMNPMNYHTLAKMYNHLAWVYGKNDSLDIDELSIYPQGDKSLLSTGLGLMCGNEIGNEEDRTWEGWLKYGQPRETAAWMSAVYDGHCGTLADENGQTKFFGIKNADASQLVIYPGVANISSGYLREIYWYCKQMRADGKFPMDVYNVHCYPSNKWLHGWIESDSAYAVPFEETMAEPEGEGTAIAKIVDFRNRYIPGLKLWLTEFGYGESGGEGTQSQYQCYSQPGRRINNWLIPDRHRSEVKGAWLVRFALTLMKLGFDKCHCYAIEHDSYFDTSQYGGGAGFEMFHWNDEKSTEPGAKYNAIKKHMVSHDRSGFATTGFFNSQLWCGGYPVSNAMWWVATFRNRLKGYRYIGTKNLAVDSRVMVYCFKKDGEDKGAYAIYLNDKQNTGIPNVNIPLPAGNERVTKVSTYIPEQVNPEVLPYMEYDEYRTGLPTTRREVYQNGQWVIANNKFGSKYESFAQGAAEYPANPQEGDEVFVLPTREENPYFPIVGPVGAVSSIHMQKPSANEYEWIDPSDPVLPNGDSKWSLKGNQALAWRQVDAVYDYITKTPEGIRGVQGDEVTMPVSGDVLIDNVSEFPDYYFFDGVPDVDYTGHVTDVSAVAVNTNTIKLYWNNYLADDTHYEVFMSLTPEAGYSLVKTVVAGLDNYAEVSGLDADTVYYFKVRPLCGDKEGELSDYAFARTYGYVAPVTDIRLSDIRATRVTLSWDYAAGSNFVAYSLYRSAGGGAFTLLARIKDGTVKTFRDAGLNPGADYAYRIRVFTDASFSAYSESVGVTTLTAEQSAPEPQEAYTDKLGSKVIVRFDMEIEAFDDALKSQFTLSENGSVRLIRSAAVDESNAKNIVLVLEEGVLGDYDSGNVLRLRYEQPDTSPITSLYGVPVERFEDFIVANNTGNLENLRAIYKINLCSIDDTLPVSEEWNNFILSKDNEGNDVRVDIQLKDSYGRTSSIIASAPAGGNIGWASSSSFSGITTDIEAVEPVVAGTGWLLPFQALVTENRPARLALANLNAENKYTVKAYPFVKNYGTVDADQRTRMKINGLYSNIANAADNTSQLVIIEDAKPDNTGVLTVDFFPMREVQGYNVAYSFLFIEEYTPGSGTGDTDVWIRSLSVKEDAGSGVNNPNIHMHVVSVGEVTHYRISEGDINDAPWLGYTSVDVPFVLSDGFTDKTVSVQLKNEKTESNVRAVTVRYNDPYIPLELKNIYINDDDAITYNKDVQVFIEKAGMPARYRLSENADFAGSQWLQWVDGTVRVPFTLSEGSEQKTVYAQLMDDVVTTAAKVDTIVLSEVAYKTATLQFTVPAGTVVNSLKVAPLKYNKRFAYGLTSDDTHVSAWNVVFKYFNGQWMDDLQYFHLLDRDGNVNAYTTGEYAPRALTYTDGLGTRRRFAVQTANWYNTNSNNFDNAGGLQYPYLLWPEVEEMIDFDGGLSIHDVRNPENDSDATIADIHAGIDAANEYVRNRIGRNLLVVTQPGNNTMYMSAAQSHAGIRLGTSGQLPYVSLFNNPSLNVDNFTMGRYFSEGQTTEKYRSDFLKQITENPGPGYFGEFGCHGSGRNKPNGAGVESWGNLAGFFDWLCDTYGEHGDDTLWFASNDEVIQYLAQAKHSTVGYEMVDTTLYVTVKIPVFADFQWSELTLLADISHIPTDVNEGSSVIGLSYGQVSGADYNFMVNVNMDEALVRRAEKYTAKFEASPIAVNRRDAEYFIGRLKPSLRGSFQSRIDAMTAVPVVSDFVINGGAETTDEREITCSFGLTGRGSEYMISESADFAGAKWMAYDGSGAVPFVLGLFEGSHNIYFKMRNDFGESGVVSDGIVFRPAALNLNGIVINGGDSATTDVNVVIEFDYVGLPTHYRLGTTADLSAVGWSVFSGESVSYVLDDNVYGAKGIYAQLKSATVESAVVSGSIVLNNPDMVKAVVSFAFNRPGGGVAYPTDANYPVVNGEIINYIANGRAAQYQNTPLKNTYGGDFGVFLAQHEYPDDGITYVQGVYEYTVTPPEGIYPNLYIQKSLCGDTRTENNRIRLEFRDIAPGNYRVKILASSNNSNTNTADKQSKCFYVVNGITVSPTFDLQNNSSQYITADVVVGGDGVLYVSYYNTIPAGNTPCLNLVEVIKL